MITCHSIETADGIVLPATLYRPDGALHSAVILAGAYAVPQGFYARFARWLAEQGIATLTFDYRGIGEARPASLRGYPATAMDWGQRDLAAALAFLHTTFPERPRYLIGHSFGGQALGLADGVEDLSGALVVASGFVTRWQWQGLRGLLLTAQVALLMPILTRVMGYLPGWAGLGEDVPSGAGLEWRKWLFSPNYLLDHVPDAVERYARVGGPVRIVRFTDDEIISPTAVDLMRRGLTQAEVQVLSPGDAGLSAIGHMGFFRPRCRTLWPMAADALSDWQQAA